MAIGLWSAGIWFDMPHADHDRRPTRADLVTVYREAERAAPVASAWAGWDIPPEASTVFAHHERHNVNSDCNCDGGSPGTRKPNGDVVKRNDRAAGYFGMTVPAVERWGRDLEKRVPSQLAAGLDFRIPRAQDYLSRDLWTKAVCRWLVAHPREQVWIFFRLLAFHLRENAGGNLYVLFEIYKGPEGDHDYAWLQRDIWQRRGWKWPRNGQLHRFGLETDGAAR